jgi:hypothetical protein
MWEKVQKMKIMKKIITLLLLLAAFPVFAQQVTDITIVNHQFFNDLPSASGVEIYNNKIYLVADDLPWLFELNNQWEVLNKYPVSGNTQIENGRTPKKIKADFESMALVKYQHKDYMLILSSGSKRVKRDTAYLFSMKKKKVVYKANVRSWYEEIKKKSVINNEDEINIEGVAVANNNIYVMHRGNISGNFMAVSSQDDFINYLTGKTKAIPQVKIYRFKLPSENGISAGLSGAATLPDNNGLIVTASLEATSDVISDGAVLGSYLGYISFEGMEKDTINLTIIRNANGQILTKKQEGITIISVDKAGKYRALTVCDNDDGSSDMFEFSFKIR